MFFDEITASSLVKIDLQGKKVGDSPFPVNPAGFIIHSAIHAARHDAKCVLHTHSLNGVAVSTQRAGLLPISQQSIFVLASLGYHDFEGLALHDDEKPRLVADLGDNTHLILRNHGLLTVGETVADAFVAMYYLEASCAIQVRAQSGGGELIPVGKDIIDDGYTQVPSRGRRGGRGRAGVAGPAPAPRPDGPLVPGLIGGRDGHLRAGPRRVPGRLDLEARGGAAARGGPPVHAPTLDGCAERHDAVRPGITVGTHAKEVAQFLFFEDLKDVVLVGTSSGGMVICKAAELARDRIERLVFVDALALLPGRAGGQDREPAPEPQSTELTTGPGRADAEQRLFADLTPDVRAWALARYTPHPVAALEAPMEPTTFWDQAWPATVIRCRRAVNPPEAHQRRTAERLKAAYHELDTGHYPMLSQPEELTRLLLVIPLTGGRP